MAVDWTNWLFSVASATTVAIAIALYYRWQKKNDVELKGQFGHKAIAKVQARTRKMATEDEEDKKLDLAAMCPFMQDGPAETIESINMALKSTKAAKFEIRGTGTEELIEAQRKKLEEQSSDTDQLPKKLHGKMASAELRATTNKLEHAMTAEQREEEAIIRRQQIESIFALMKQQQEKFGVQSEADVVEQMKLYI